MVMAVASAGRALCAQMRIPGHSRCLASLGTSWASSGVLGVAALPRAVLTPMQPKSDALATLGYQPRLVFEDIRSIRGVDVAMMGIEHQHVAPSAGVDSADRGDQLELSSVLKKRKKKMKKHKHRKHLKKTRMLRRRLGKA